MMQRYIGTKIIHAVREDRPDERPSQEDGYAVIYPGGYRSWSPKDVFEEAYRPCDAMTFGLATEALKKGLKVARSGWNGKGMWLVLASNWNANLGSPIGTPNAAPFDMPSDWDGVAPFIAMYTADKKLVPWLASQTDMLAEDWGIIDQGYGAQESKAANIVISYKFTRPDGVEVTTILESGKAHIMENREGARCTLAALERSQLTFAEVALLKEISAVV
jgi:hypothetical protein